MGVLERLERESREARERRAAEAGAREAHDGAARSRLAPALDRAASYLESLALHLGERDPAILADYGLDEVGTLTGLRQGAYRVARGEDVSDSVELRFECTGPNPLEATVDGHARAEARARGLRDAGLRCHLAALSTRMMRLRVEPKVPARVGFAADPEHRRIWLELRNLTTIGTERYPLGPERVDEELLDAVACLVLREPSNLAALTGSVVADTERAALKRRLARESRKREAELAGGIPRLVFPLAEWFRRQFLGG